MIPTLAPISRARTIAAVKSLFGFCHRMRYLPTNAAAELPLPRYENRLAERILGEDDVRRMLVTQQRPRDRILLQLLYLAGLRVSEACHLRWRNLRPQGDAGQISVFGKNGRTRAIALPAPLCERRDFWEICEDRYQVRSTILTSQLPVSRWHEQIGDPTLIDVGVPGGPAASSSSSTYFSATHRSKRPNGIVDIWGAINSRRRCGGKR